VHVPAEVLCGAGYNALTTLSINDARILLKATKGEAGGAVFAISVGARQNLHRRCWRKLIRQFQL